MIVAAGFRWRTVQALLAGMLLGIVPMSQAGASPDDRVPDAPEAQRMWPSISGDLVTFTQRDGAGVYSLLSHQLSTGRERVIASPVTGEVASQAGTPWVLTTLDGNTANPVFSAVSTSGRVETPTPTGGRARISGNLLATSGVVTFEPTSTAYTLHNLVTAEVLTASFPTPRVPVASSIDIAGNRVALLGAPEGFGFGYGNASEVSLFEGTTRVSTHNTGFVNGCTPLSVRLSGDKVFLTGMCFAPLAMEPTAAVWSCTWPCASLSAPHIRELTPGAFLDLAPLNQPEFSNGRAALVDRDHQIIWLYDAAQNGPLPVLYRSSGSIDRAQISGNKMVFSERTGLNGQVRSDLYVVNIDTGSLKQLTPAGPRSIQRPTPGPILHDPDISGGTISYVTDTLSSSQVWTQSLGSGARMLVTQTATPVGSSRLSSEFVMWNELIASGDTVRAKSRGSGPAFTVTPPASDVPTFPNQIWRSSFDVEGSRAIVASQLTDGAVNFTVAAGRLTNLPLTPVALATTQGQSSTNTGPVQAGSFGVSWTRLQWSVEGGRYGIGTVSTTGQQSFIEIPGTVAVGAHWTRRGNRIASVSPNFTGHIVQWCSLPCEGFSFHTLFDAATPDGPPVLVGSKLLYRSNTQLLGPTVDGVPRHTQIRMIDLDRPGLPILVADGSSRYSDLRIDGNTVVWSQVGYVHGVKVGQLYSYDVGTRVLSTIQT